MPYLKLGMKSLMNLKALPKTDMTSVEVKEEYLNRGLGAKKLFGKQETVQLYMKTWTPSKPDSVVSCVVFVHGIGEHCSRYHAMFSEFASKGVKVASFDQRGFGKTVKKSGSKGVSSFSSTFDDIKTVVKMAKIEGKPLFIMGHSMGGGIALLFSSLYPEGISGVIASAPMIEAGSFTKPNSAEMMLMRSFVPTTLPNLVIPTKIDINNISRDPEQMRLYKEDELIHGWGSVGLLTEVIISCGELLTKHHKSFSHPLLVTHGALDTLTCPEASKKFVDICRSTDKNHILFPGCVHELHNEPLDDRIKVYETYLSWILERSK